MNDDELDTQLRAWASDARESAPPVDVAAAVARASRTAHRSRLVPALSAAAAVVVVAAAITAVQLTSSGGSAPAAHETAASSTAPAGMRRVVFHGLAIDVPTGWPLNATFCGTPTRDTVILPGIVPLCLTSPRPGVTSVEFAENELPGLAGTLTGEHTSQTPIGGVPASRLTGIDEQGLHVIAVKVPSLKAQVVIRSPDATEASRLAGSLTTVGTGPDGCATRDDALGVLPTGQPPARPGADQQLIPGTPTSIVVCRYVAGLIEQSASLDTTDRRSLTALLNALPQGLSRAVPEHSSESVCRSPATAAGSLTGNDSVDSEAYLIRADYETGPSVTVTVRLGMCGALGASNGTRTGQRTDDLNNRITTIAGTSVGYPVHVQPAH